MRMGVDLDDISQRSAVFDDIAFLVRFRDETEDTLHGTAVTNLANIKNPGDWTLIRGRRIATVFQDPMTSLNPIITIGKQITSIIIKHQGCSEVEARTRAIDLMYKVGIPNAERRFDDYPFQYSGGMRQRIVIAIALSCQPKILICDEPTTALDVTIQAQILKLLKDLQKEFNYTIVFITHDLGVVAKMCDDVAIVYAGRIVESGTLEDVFNNTMHPYTEGLFNSLPNIDNREAELKPIPGLMPDPTHLPKGCAFAPRCSYATDACREKMPEVRHISETHTVCCSRYDEPDFKIEGWQ
ncbi:MAG: ABC transporter ATP-binding protein [Ruminococcaceae bacterium]|nr:ABC transporter ATP-binding protein [Oscillospiraceae bacterium]